MFWRRYFGLHSGCGQKAMAALMACILLFFSVNIHAEAIGEQSRGADEPVEPLSLEEGSACDSDEDAGLYFEGTLVYQGSDFTVSAEIGSEAGMPEDTRIQAREIVPETEEYEAYLTRLNGEENNIWHDEKPIRLFDIAFYAGTEDTVRIEPQDTVRVGITFGEPISAAEDAEIRAVHFTETGVPRDVRIDSYSAEEDSGENLVNSVSFQADSFSVFGVYTKQKMNKKEAEYTDDKYRVVFNFGDQEQVPANSELEIRELSGEEYDSHMSLALSCMETDTGSVTYGQIFAATVRKNKKVYESYGAVSVSIELPEEAARSIRDVKVICFEKTDSPVGTPVERTASLSGNTVAFDANNLYAFALLDFSAAENNQIQAEISQGSDPIHRNDSLSLAGSMPICGEVDAEAVDAQIEGKDTLAAYDITIYANADLKEKSIVWQPGENGVEVTLQSDALTAEYVDIYHIPEADGTPEFVATAQVQDHRVSFLAKSFSIYAIIAHEGDDVVTPRVEFHFISYYSGDAQTDSDNTTAYYAVDPYQFKNKNDELQTTQILKDGESLELIADPVNQNSNYFYGWYVVDPCAISGTTDEYGIGTSDQKLYYTWPENPDRITFESPADVSISTDGTVSWSLNGVSGSGAVDADGCTHVFLAPLFDKYHFVNFMLRSRSTTGSNNLMTRKLVALGSASSAEVKISDIRSNSTDPVHLVFAGWEYYDTASNAWVTKQTVEYTGATLQDEGKDGVYLSVVPTTESIDLYPVFVEARWVDFFSGVSGSGASYVASRFLESWGRATESNPPEDTADKNVFTSLAVSSREGYSFAGWYAFANTDPDTGEITNLTTPEDTDISYLTIDTNGDYVTNTVTVNTTAVQITNGDGSICDSGIWSITDDGNGTGILNNDGSGQKLIQLADGKLRFFDSLDRLKLCAGWEPDASQITVVYWTENVQDENYSAPQDPKDDYTASAVKVITTDELNTQAATIGAAFGSGATITLDQLELYTEDTVSVLDRTLLDDVGAVLTGEEKFYDLNTELSDASVVISGDGSTMINVYFSRKVFTLVFHIGRDGYISTSGEQTSSNNGSWLQMFYNDSMALKYDALEGVTPGGGRGASQSGMAVISYNGTDYTSAYETNSANIKNDYVPGAGENVYTIRAKYGAYIGDRWPTPTNSAFTFTDNADNKDMYTWSAYYESRFAQLANDRKGSGQNWHPDINGVYSYMSAEMCSNRDGTAIINENQVHHLVAYFGDARKAGVVKNYHILYEAVDGTYDPNDSGISVVSGSAYAEYNQTTWTLNVAQASASLLEGRSFYEVSSYTAISNLPPESQLATEIDGYELIYSCYNTPSTNEHHIYFLYTPKQYTLTFNLGSTTETDTYYYTQTLENADQYTDEVAVPEGCYFKGWYTNTEGAGDSFDFANEKMPSQNVVLYPILRILQYTVKIDPNGGVLDHRANSSVSTYFTADYGTPIGEYSTTREYIPLTEKELDASDTTHYYTGTKYYYINTQRLGIASEGEWGLPTELRNAVYVTEDELDTYYNWYCGKISSADQSYWSGISALSRQEFIDNYTSYPYRKVNGEHYTFMGWYEVSEDGSTASMPYNFNDPVTGPLELRALWRLDGGYYIQYNPYYFADDGDGNVTAIIGEVEQWTDPGDPTAKLYADQSPTHILRAPTNVTPGWVFSGWRVVRADGEKTFTDDSGTQTYTDWEPYVDLNYYQPGDSFTIDAALVTEVNSTGKVIHMQAYYEEETSSARRPEIINLTLDANDPRGGYVDPSAGDLPAFEGPGSIAFNTAGELDAEGRPTQILFGDLQSNLAVHLYRYATDQIYNGVTGTEFFRNTNHYFLLGFDENSDPNNPTTGKAYIPAYAADAAVAVTRNDNRTLYALWEPMVYVTFVNTTDSDLVIDLSGTGASTVSIVNEVTGEFDREQMTTSITVPARSGDTNGQVKIVLPGAEPGEDSVTARAVNAHAGYKLSVSGAIGSQDPYGQGSDGVRYSKMADYTGILQADATGIIVTYTEETEPSVIFDVNGGTWQETEDSFIRSTVDTDIYTIIQADVESNGGYEPADPLEAGKIFVGWTTNTDIAAQTDFSPTAAVTWGSTTIVPDADSNVLEKVRGEYLWDFSQDPPYGQTLYAVWTDVVTVTFDLIRNGSNYHNWTGPSTTDEEQPYAYYCSSAGERYVTYTAAKGEKIPRPQDPTVDTSWGRSDFAFLDWILTLENVNTSTNPAAINEVLFDFTEPVLSDTKVYTSWMSRKYVRKYTYTVCNQIEGGTAGEEFDYTITAASNMNYSGTYYTSDPAAILPVTVKLKNNETYTTEVTAVRYSANGWNHNSLYLVVKDRDGAAVSSGHLLEYHRNASTVDYETSDYQVALTVTQTAKAGYTTTITAPDDTTVNLGAQSYTFTNGNGNNRTSSTVTTDADSFTFRSSSGNTTFVGTNENNSIGTSIADVTETIVFHNVSDDPVYPAPTGYSPECRPFMIILGLGMVLICIGKRKRRKDEV